MEAFDLGVLLAAVSGVVQLYKLVMAKQYKSALTIVVAVASAVLGGELAFEELEIVESVAGGFAAVGVNTNVRQFGKDK